MKLKLQFIVLSVLSFFLGINQIVAQSPRKKVAVVLGGGGAKGVAHVRALKVIEEAGIPIDCVVGTSMGSIIGGLYAAGYSTSQMDSIIACQNWMKLLSDAESRENLTLSKKLNTDRYFINLSFEKTPTELIQGGVLKGNRIGKLFSDLTIGYHDSIDFQKLPIPFACVAVDIVRNEEIVFKSGILAECMRASMSIPGAFAPIKKHGKVLVDGGLANNFPVDVARSMGADYVIGVNVSGGDKTADEINTTMDMLSQILDVVCRNKFEENKQNTDVLIDVDVKGYSAASFTSEAIDTLLVHGEKAARDKWDDLLALKEKIGLTGPVAERPDKVIPLDTVVAPIPSIYQETNKNSQINIGARFDSEELASMLIGGTYQLNAANNSELGVEVRLGRRMNGRLSWSFEPVKKWTLTTAYQLKYNETKLRDAGEKAGTLTYAQHDGLFCISRSWKEVLVSFGLNYRYTHFHDFVGNQKWVNILSGINDSNEQGVGYFASMQFDSQDARVLPRKGLKWSIKYTFYTDNFVKFDDQAGMHILEGYWQGAFSLSRNFTLIPSVAGRMLPKRNTHFSNNNFMGGVDMYGHYVSQQLSFAGANFLEMAPHKMLIAGLSARQWIGNSNLYLFEAASYRFLCHEKSLQEYINTRYVYGAAAGLGYKTIAGPVQVHFDWSSLTKELYIFLNFGYMF